MEAEGVYVCGSECMWIEVYVDQGVCGGSGCAGLGCGCSGSRGIRLWEDQSVGRSECGEIRVWWVCVGKFVV